MGSIMYKKVIALLGILTVFNFICYAHGEKDVEEIEVKDNAFFLMDSGSYVIKAFLKDFPVSCQNYAFVIQSDYSRSDFYDVSRTAC